ncbi:type I-E CRISPR-associated protein Cse2/CasB [Actinocorallia sp. A-T 12471]|uniref:type I-E CRISPR-associated protein Cse2/CasB n=1 Tax=Actinocorallia sp. A-T 12471 TaxID=3089813 RepID=UPI0029CF1DCE|nr:type I-E CRISPR-associated protein Cse2/CasB [Actinocorallia sp. A-T 12471]MDX6741538.1 type I-E CRISPR-associated protein Cse2/CasB [Actinocorallia sp. A-T 12471]
MTEPRPSAGADPERLPVPHDSSALTAWLTTLVRNREYGTLAELRRARGGTNAHIRAGWYGGDEHRDMFERIAFLFAIYHQGRSSPSYGTGSLGEAARRIGDGTGRGPDNPGAQRLMARITAPRRGVPWRHLQHAVTRLRSCEQPPPSWTELADDLVFWNDRRARIGYWWSVEFHTPPEQDRAARTNPTTNRRTPPRD